MLKHLITVLFVFYTLTAQAAPTRQPKVIIIGAGMAGLAAAHELENHDIHPIILEARNRVGGRIHTIKPWGQALDLGATWIHGVENNPIAKLANQLHLKTVPTIYDDTLLFEKFKSFVLYDEQGQRITSDSFGLLIKHGYRFMDYLENHASELHNKSLQFAFDLFLPKQSLSSIEMQLLNHFVINSHVYEYAADLADTAATIEQNYANSNVSGANVLFPKGYSQLLPHFTSNIHVKLNEVVTQINYQHHGVDVYTKTHHYHADKVIVTVPLGVLKANMIRFTPALPKEKQQAIHDLKMGVYNKVYLHFDHVFWDKQPEWIGQLPPAGKEKEIWDVFNFSKFDNNPDLLVFTGGSFAKRVEHLSDTDTIHAIMAMLRSIYGADIPEPLSYVITRWNHDPYTRGSYSYHPPETDISSEKALATSVADKLFFAGEATSTTDPATVQGAYLSGLRAAKEAL